MNQTELHTLGIDIGSTTVKIAVLDSNNDVLFSDYERHFANIQETLSDLLGRAIYKLGQIKWSYSGKASWRTFCPGGCCRFHRSSGLCTTDRCSDRAGRRRCQDHLF